MIGVDDKETSGIEMKKKIFQLNAGGFLLLPSLNHPLQNFMLLGLFIKGDKKGTQGLIKSTPVCSAIASREATTS